MASYNGTALDELKETLVTGHTSRGAEIRGTIVKLSRFSILFEIYGPVVLQMSEVLSEFRIVINSHATYSGQATIRNLMDTGSVLICEATLSEDSWRDVDLDTSPTQNGSVRNTFDNFFEEWQKVYKVLPEYKLLIADIQVFLTDLRLWLEQFELNIRALPSGDRVNSERELVDRLVGPISTSLNYFFEKLELIAAKVDEDLQPVHALYARRQLHPLLLSSPFMHRIFRKPLGYAGDYEMVNMILRDPHEGSSVFSQVLNTWFLSQTPAAAHRNRVKLLTQRMVEESRRISASPHGLRVFNLGCGPAGEVVDFIQQYGTGKKSEFTLLDFNEETLRYTESVLNQTKQRYPNNVSVRMLKKSVVQLLKSSGRSTDEKYDLVYCAGLFDYLQDRVCKQVVNIMYEMLAPGGLLIATNVDSVNPIQNIMGFVFEWHLIYRSHDQFASLAPDDAHADSCKLIADSTGCNIFMEVRKPLGTRQ